ncbi:MAG: aminoacyl-tRNA hydrolase, partial [Clostridia bacterium]|nr:aminoacyl-tRNA hydrolase [Clostridia bacterium]
GNPGLQYEKTRHNAGFLVMDKLCEKYRFSLSKHKFEAVIGEFNIGDKRILAAKPQTYMNNSGNAVSKIVSFYKIPLEKVIIIFDDISLDIGNIRIRRKGSAGGHNDIKDIIECCGSEEIPRIKIGVDKKPTPEYDLKDFVLSKIPKEKYGDFEKSLENSVGAVEEMIKNGIDSAMNKYSK